MGPTTPIAVVGNLNLDVKTAPIPADPRVMADGETSVAELYETLGGGGANTAVAAARMGGAVSFVAALGADALGDRLAAFLGACGVEPRLTRKPAATGRSLALNWANHQRHFVSCLPSALLLEASDVDVAGLAAAGCRHLYRADLWFAPRMLAEGNLAVLNAARRRGLATSIDLNWDPRWHAGRDDPEVRERLAAVARLLPEVSYAHGNERELTFFAGAPTLAEAARWYFDHGASALIVHRGARGSAALTADGGVVEVPAVPVDRVVSEACTGDVFTAAFLLRDDLALPERLAQAGAVAARHLAGRADFVPRLPG